MMMPVSRTVIETDMSTAEEMIHMVASKLQQLHLTSTKTESVLGVWRNLVRSATPSTREVYTLKRPVMVAGFFPHIKPYPDFPILCVSLGPEDLEPTGTPDASRVAWYQCTLSLHINPPVWELDEELWDLKDPPAVCRVTVCVSNLVFKEVLEASAVLRISQLHKAAYFVLYNDQLHTQQEMDAFVRNFRFMAGFFHCSSSNPQQLAESVWFDLMHAQLGKNVFMLRLPYLLRMASEAYSVPEALRRHVYKLEQSEADSISYPPGLDPSTFIGLYSASYQLTFSTEKDRAPPAGRELWPDVPSVFSELFKKQPGCSVALVILHIEFVSTVKEAEILAMCHAPSQAKKILTPFKWVNDFAAFFDNL
jgi:hypothetical protein